MSQQQDFRYPKLLLALYVPIWVVLAISPLSRSDWLLENLLVLAALPMLIATARRMRFSDATYTCLFIFFVLHSLGAHYTYALVPYDRWWTALGTQGDEWDAQQDMALAAAGATLSMLFLRFRYVRSHRAH